MSEKGFIDSLKPSLSKYDLKNLDEKVIKVKRISKTVKGGRKMSFNALVAVGNKQGKVGLGLAKASEVKEAVRKAIERARRNIIQVSMNGDTLDFPITYKYKAAKVMLRPAGPGTGLIAGGATRDVLELAGIKNVLSKQLGANGALNNARATFLALEELHRRKFIFSKRVPSKNNLK